MSEMRWDKLRCVDGDDDYDEKKWEEFCWENRWTYIDDMSVHTKIKDEKRISFVWDLTLFLFQYVEIDE